MFNQLLLLFLNYARYKRGAAYERHAYDEHINAIMIQNDVLDNAKREGRAEGRAEEKLENGKSLLAIGVLPEKVAETLKMPLDEVMKLMKK